MTTRADILSTALRYTTADRNTTHGEPCESFEHIAVLWSAVLTLILNTPVTLTPWQVGVMMVGFKLARTIDAPENHENWIDIAGYAGCGGECVEQPKGETL